MLGSDLAHIRKVLEEARKGNLAQKMGDLLTFFQCRGYAHLQQISCKHVGCHEANRDGQMVDVTHVQDLLKSFATLGSAPESSLSGICIELGHDDGSNTTRKKNQELIEKSNGKLGGDTTILKYASVSGSHRNQCMPSVVYRCLCDDPEVVVEGKWSLDRFDEAFQKACTSGTQWLVVSRDVLAAFPDWAALQQAASNATGQQQKVETELQALQKICSIVLSKLEREKMDSLSFNTISPEIMRSRPACRNSIPWLFQFVMKFGAGSPLHVKRTEEYCSSHGRSSRLLGSEFWDQICQETKTNSLIVWRHLLIRAAYCWPERTFSVNDATRRMCAARVFICIAGL